MTDTFQGSCLCRAIKYEIHIEVASEACWYEIRDLLPQSQ